MTGLLYVYCDGASREKPGPGGRNPDPRRPGLIARVRTYLRAAFRRRGPARTP